MLLKVAKRFFFLNTIMSSQTYYKLSTFFLGLFSIFLFLLIVTPFTESAEEIKEESLTFEDELRMHRQVFLRIINSNNPLISEEIKSICKHKIEEIDEYIYSGNSQINPEREKILRQKIRMVNYKIKNEMSYPSNLFNGRQKVIVI